MLQPGESPFHTLTFEQWHEVQLYIFFKNSSNFIDTGKKYIPFSIPSPIQVVLSPKQTLVEQNAANIYKCQMKLRLEKSLLE